MCLLKLGLLRVVVLIQRVTECHSNVLVDVHVKMVELILSKVGPTE
jgi:hypothetical protein